MDNISYGYCHCGCGIKTNISPRTNSARDHVKGEPFRFIAHHHKRLAHLHNLEARCISEDRGYETPCLIWQGGISSAGYPNPWLPPGQSRQAHRIIYEQHHGPIPKDLVIDHLCLQRACLNIDHLEAVTHRENIRRGPRTKLTMRKARLIRQLRKEGATMSELARLFDVHKSTIANVIWGKTWQE